jgi:hypothetical protein
MSEQRKVAMRLRGELYNAQQRAEKFKSALREADEWLNGNHISTAGDAQRSFNEAAKIVRAALTPEQK